MTQALHRGVLLIMQCPEGLVHKSRPADISVSLSLHVVSCNLTVIHLHAHFAKLCETTEQCLSLVVSQLQGFQVVRSDNATCTQARKVIVLVNVPHKQHEGSKTKLHACMINITRTCRSAYQSE